MRIKGWDKLNGITYRGYSILNPIYNALQTQYVADIIFLETKERMTLHLDTTAGFQNESYILKLQDSKNRINVQRILTFEMLKTISNFRMVFEMCIEDYLKEVEATWTNQYGTSNVAQAQTAQLPKSSSLMPSFDDFVKMWRTTPVGQFTQTLIEK